MSEHDATEPDSGPILVTVDGAVATVMLNRPRSRNAINLASWRSLRDAASSIAANTAVRVAILTGAGDAAFSAGADISEFAEHRLTLEAAAAYGDMMEAALHAWEQLRVPVIAAIRGFCLGAGLELALTADFRIAAEVATFGVPATRRGFGISVDDARRLAAVVGPARARGLLLTGDQVSSAEALRLGLVDEVIAEEALDGRVWLLAVHVAANAPLAVAWVKEAMRLATGGQGDAELDDARRHGAHVFATRDAAEGAASFLERRLPRFEGR